jgi:hypothetical protein
MPVQGLAFDSVRSSDLTVGQHLNLLDLAQLALSQRTIQNSVSMLALRLHYALKFGVVTLGLCHSSEESICLSICKAGEAERRCECLPAQFKRMGLEESTIRTYPRFGYRTQVARFLRVASPTGRAYLLCFSLDHKSSQTGSNRVWQFACRSQDECDA